MSQEILHTILQNCAMLDENYNLPELEQLAGELNLLTDENEGDKDLLCTTLAVHYNLNLEQEKLAQLLHSEFGIEKDVGKYLIYDYML